MHHTRFYNICNLIVISHKNHTLAYASKFLRFLGMCQAISNNICILVSEESLQKEEENYLMGATNEMPLS